MRRFYFAFVLLLSIISPVSGKYLSGSVSNGKDWVLVSKFSFIDDIGQLDYNVEYSVTDECCPSLAYYLHDTFESVDSNDDMSCQSKMSHAEGVVAFQNIQPDNLTKAGNFSTQCSFVSNATTLRQCSGTLRLQSIQDRWWFFVLSHCNSTKGLDISYELTFTNGVSWEKHLSAEEIHILESQAVSLGGILVLFVAGLYFTRQLLQQDKLHRAFKFFMMSLTYEAAAQLFSFIYYTHYVRSGVQLHSLHTVTELSQATSDVTFIMLLILLAYGWTMTKVHLGHKTQMKLTVFFSIYTLTYGILFVLKQELFDGEGSHLLFESLVDKGYCTLRLIAWVCFVSGAILSLQNYPGKKKFYLYFGICYSVWFLFQPLSAIAASFLFDEELRAMRIVRLNPLFCFLGFAGLLFSVMRPGKANVNFPFHVRGNEVDPVQIQEPSNFQQTEAFLDIGNKEAGTLGPNLTNMDKLGKSDDKSRFGFRS